MFSVREMRIMICCGRCGGTGKVRSAEIERTAKATSTKRGMTSKEIFDKLKETGIGVTAINNRLEILRRAGVVTPVGKRHKAILWQRVRVTSPATIQG